MSPLVQESVYPKAQSTLPYCVHAPWDRPVDKSSFPPYRIEPFAHTQKIIHKRQLLPFYIRWGRLMFVRITKTVRHRYIMRQKTHLKGASSGVLKPKAMDIKSYFKNSNYSRNLRIIDITKSSFFLFIIFSNLSFLISTKINILINSKVTILYNI